MTPTAWEDWRVRSRCLDIDPDVMFPDNNAEQIAAAKRVCTGCEVRRECLQDALALDERDGVWGGYTYGERKNLAAHGVARRHYLPKAECPSCGRLVSVERAGLRRHNRPDAAGAKGWSGCPGVKP